MMIEQQEPQQYPPPTPTEYYGPRPPVGPAERVKKPRRRIVVPTVIGAAAFFIGLGVGLGAGGGDATSSPTPGTTEVVTVVVTAPPTAVSEPAAEVTTKPAAAAVTVEDGIWTVGVDIPAGKYRTTAPVSGDCYWAITKSGTNGEDIISNDLPSGGRPQVTVKKGQDFNTQGCGTWQKIG
jgi:hypothetical protein